MARARDLLGRTIVAVDFGLFRARQNHAGWAHSPILTLDNGARVQFVVEETDMGAYGVDIVVSKARKK